MKRKTTGTATAKARNYAEVMEYVESILSGEKAACDELIMVCRRFKDDLLSAAYDFDTKAADFVIQVIEKTCRHTQGEDLDGAPLRGKPLLLEPWQKFIIYNLLGFFLKGTKIRRFKEAFIYVPRKNGKTSFVAALSWALALLQRKSGSTIYIVPADLKESLQSFKFIFSTINIFYKTPFSNL